MVRSLACRTVVCPFKQFETLDWFLTDGFHLLERPVGGREFCHWSLHARLSATACAAITRKYNPSSSVALTSTATSGQFLHSPHPESRIDFQPTPRQALRTHMVVSS